MISYLIVRDGKVRGEAVAFSNGHMHAQSMGSRILWDGDHFEGMSVLEGEGYTFASAVDVINGKFGGEIAGKADRVGFLETALLGRISTDEQERENYRQLDQAVNECYCEGSMKYFGGDGLVPQYVAPNETMYEYFKDLPVGEKVANKEQVAKIFLVAAFHLLSVVESGPERTVALRKLLESRDSAMRAAR